MIKIYVSIKDKKKEIGRYDEIKNIYYSDRDREKHFFHRTASWGLDYKVWEFLQRKKARICIIDKKSKIKYWSTSKDWEEKGIRDNMGYGDQMMLKEEYFKRGKNG